MSKSDTIHMRIDHDLKVNAEEILNSLGLTTTDAVNIFLKQVVMREGLPFKVERIKFDKETLAAIKRADDDIANGRVYTHEEVFGELRAAARKIANEAQ